MAMTAKRRIEWGEVAQHSVVVAVILLFGLMTGLMSGRPLRGELVETAKICAIYAAVVAAVRLPDEWVGAALGPMMLAVAAFALVAMSRGEWVKAAILAATVVLTARLWDGAGR